MNVKYDMGEKIVNGDLHWTLPKWTHTTNLQGGAEFQFQNLFNGNKQLCKCRINVFLIMDFNALGNDGPLI